MSALNSISFPNNFTAATVSNKSYDINENTEVFRFQDGEIKKQTLGELLTEDITPVYFKPSIESLELKYQINDALQSPPDTHPVNLFATVTVNGEVVAEVFNKGTTKNYSVDTDLPDEPDFGKSLAQTRLDALLDATGGDVTYANLTQTERAAQIAAYEPPRYIHPSFVGIEEKYNAIQNGTSTLSNYEQESIRQLYEDERYQKYF